MEHVLEKHPALPRRNEAWLVSVSGMEVGYTQGLVGDTVASLDMLAWVLTSYQSSTWWWWQCVGESSHTVVVLPIVLYLHPHHCQRLG